MTAMLMVLLAAGCSEPSKMESTPRPDVPSEATPEVAAPADPAPADDAPSDSPPSVGSDGLTVPSTVSLGSPYTVVYDRQGPNGCYRQTDVVNQMNTGEKKVFHRYTTSFEGEMCTQMLVPGGFTTEVTLPERGTWSGTVQVDGKTLSAYTVTVE